MTICALVVTYNRPQLLIESLEAIVNQRIKVSEIIIIDNFSTPETLYSLKNANFIPSYEEKLINFGGELKYNYSILNTNTTITIHYKRLPQNTGGSGGFNKGIRYFYENTLCDLLWIMDDDVEAKPDALEKLVESYTFLHSKNICCGYLCSLARWIDNTPCKMNTPAVKQGDAFNMYDSNYHILESSSATFVSLLIPRNVIKQVGLPYKEFFIWYDDVEYSTRINRYYKSYIVMDSTVIHKTKDNDPVKLVNVTQDNFYKHKFGLRNTLFSLLRINKLAAFNFFRLNLAIIFKTNLRPVQKIKLLVALFSGFTFHPKKEELK